MPVNDPNVNQSYKGLELAVVKRLTNRWQFLGSYSATKKNIPNYGFLSAGSFATGSFDSAHQVGNLTPNDEINRSDRTWEWNGKVMGAYVFPADVQLSANYEHRSGDVFARQVRFTGGQTIPQYRAERGADRDPAHPEPESDDLPCREGLSYPDHAEARGATQYLQRVEREHGHRRGGAGGILVPAAAEHPPASHLRAERGVRLLASCHSRLAPKGPIWEQIGPFDRSSIRYRLELDDIPLKTNFCTRLPSFSPV